MKQIEVSDDFIIVCIFALILIAMILFNGCALNPVMDPIKAAEEVYRRDLKVNIDGIDYVGTGVLPRNLNYQIKISPQGKADRIIVTTCHRENVYDSPSSSGWFDKTYSISLSPQTGIEDSRSCPVEIVVLEEKKTRNGWAFFDIQDRREEISLPGHLRCNGDYSDPSGVAVCQSAVGLTQQIFFNQEVKLLGVSEKCKGPESNDGWHWEWGMLRGNCVYYFVSNEKSKNGQRRSLRLNTLGFTSVPVRN